MHKAFLEAEMAAGITSVFIVAPDDGISSHRLKWTLQRSSTGSPQTISNSGPSHTQITVRGRGATASHGSIFPLASESMRPSW